MKKFNGKLYLSLKDVGIQIGKSYQTMLFLLRCSEQQERQGEERLLPVPCIIDGIMHFSSDQAEEIKVKISKLKKGDLKQFTQNNSYNQLKADNILLRQENDKLLKRVIELERKLRGITQ